MSNSVKLSHALWGCLTLCNPMNRSTPGLPVHHQLLVMRNAGLDEAQAVIKIAVLAQSSLLRDWFPCAGAVLSLRKLKYLVLTWEKEMTTHSSILAWKIPWTEEPGGLESMGLRRVGYD